jgi:hypothetical protein
MRGLNPKVVRGTQLGFSGRSGEISAPALHRYVQAASILTSLAKFVVEDP